MLKFFISTLIAVSSVLAQSNSNFSSYFSDKTLRIDYFHTGNSQSDLITIDKLYEYGNWAGNPNNTIDNFNNGKYYVKVYDSKTNKLIFSKGYDSYFFEYQTGKEALNGIKKTYHESVLIPSPKSKILVKFEKRNRENKLNEIFSFTIDPGNTNIIKENLHDSSVKVIKSFYSGNPHKKVDVVILGEGYTNSEFKKFKSDLARFTNVFFNKEPYKTNKNKFNIYGVFKTSEESGIDEPRAGIFKNTALNCTFNSLGSERYLLTEDNKTMRDLAANVPYDAIYIMVNHKRYGGGGIYNQFCTFTTNNQWSEYVFLHEFGHSFTGLADEYYTSDVAYNDFYPKGTEPVEPNITALLNAPHVKWQNLVTPGIEIPTPWNKNFYDSLDTSWQIKRRMLNDKIAKLKKENASKQLVMKLEKKYIKLDREHAGKIDSFLVHSKYWNKVGAFEGAGYASKGLYRPMLDCIMFSKGNKPFCKVCRNAISKMIKFYSE